MRKLFVTVLVLAAAASANAQTNDFLDLVAFGTGQQVQDAINHGADMKVLDFDDMTPLMTAAMHNEEVRVVRVLLQAGADVTARDRTGKTALIWAAASNPNTDVLSALLNTVDNYGHKGADTLYTRDSGDMTALMWAAWTNRNPEVITFLLRRGAVARAVDSHGKMALDYAQENDLEGTTAYAELEEASQ
jgi:uncharacterized protein